jgi:tripartite-type tricarboxylate transporter receptor subunit TctC
MRTAGFAAMIKGRLWPLLQGLLALVVSSAPSAADPIADFYTGKTMTMMVATSPGGDYDRIGRLLARHMVRFIPGEPHMLVRNMPGGVGIQAANWLASIAPRDGTSLHMLIQNMPAHQALGGLGTEFDTRRFFFIGNVSNSVNVLNSWYTTGIRTIEDAKQRELIVGAPGTATAGVYYPKVMNALFGTKFKIVMGFPNGNDVNLAMERGEVGGRGSNTWRSYQLTHPDWITEKKIIPLVQIGLARHPDLPDLPLLTDLAQNAADRELLHFISADVGIARAVVTTPETPPERVQALRRAFDATVKDREFLAEADKIQIDVSPLSGEEAQKIADSIVNTSPAILARIKALLDGPTK